MRPSTPSATWRGRSVCRSKPGAASPCLHPGPVAWADRITGQPLTRMGRSFDRNSVRGAGFFLEPGNIFTPLRVVTKTPSLLGGARNPPRPSSHPLTLSDPDPPLAPEAALRVRVVRADWREDWFLTFFGTGLGAFRCIHRAGSDADSHPVHARRGRCGRYFSAPTMASRRHGGRLAPHSDSALPRLSRPPRRRFHAVHGFSAQYSRPRKSRGT